MAITDEVLNAPFFVTSLPPGPGALPRPPTTTRRRWAARLGTLPLQPLLSLLPVRHRPAQERVKRWPVVPVERTEGVKRLLAQVAQELPAFGAGEVATTNIAHLL